MCACPRCSHPNSKIAGANSRVRASHTSRLRKRICNNCGLEFKTYEVSEADWKLTLKINAAVNSYRNGMKGNLHNE